VVEPHNWTGNCGDNCTALETEIKHCQQNNVKVFLSLGGPSGSYSMDSPTDAGNVAKYHFDNFLSGNKTGPLGNVTLNGIFALKSGQLQNFTGINLSWILTLIEFKNSFTCPLPRIVLSQIHTLTLLSKLTLLMISLFNSQQSSVSIFGGQFILVSIFMEKLDLACSTKQECFLGTTSITSCSSKWWIYRTGGVEFHRTSVRKIDSFQLWRSCNMGQRLWCG
jgi:hypothetical protein